MNPEPGEPDRFAGLFVFRREIGMENGVGLAPETREELIRRAWYIHDARWFSLVAAEFGMEAANRLNRAAVGAVAEAEAGRLLRALGSPAVNDARDALQFIDIGRQVYVAEPLMQMSFHPVDERSYEVALADCFVATNVMKAGITDRYECAVFDRVAGWHRAMGLPLDPACVPTTTCVRAHGEECRRLIRLAE